ncbi:hypothetical protein C8R43DRAFT_958744 [Mycena crocata]|nr:hypothetical protein C8R43DRAFT_958744 [Mycena crocata]
MNLLTHILGALALSGAALAQDGATLAVYAATNCAGDPTGIESGLTCNNCYHFGQDWGAANMLSGFPDDWLWYGFSNDNCGPRPDEDLGAHRGLGCFVGPARIRSVFLKCNGNPGF